MLLPKKFIAHLFIVSALASKMGSSAISTDGLVQGQAQVSERQPDDYTSVSKPEISL